MLPSLIVPRSNRILLAWEGGAGRGHIITLKTIAEALGDRFIFDAALCRMEYGDEIAPLCELVFPAAVLWVNDTRRRAAGNPHTATWGEFLGDLGFADPDFLIRQVEWWLATIKARASAMVIGDFSPCAVLAARIAGIPAVAVGTGYSTPPAGMDEFPVLLPEHTTRLYAENELVQSVNTMLLHFNQPPITRLSDIARDAVSMPRTIAALDPYNGLRSQAVLPPLNEALPRGVSGGDEIFIYFSTGERDDPVLMEAITALGVPVRLYMPNIDDALASKLAAPGLTIETKPVPLPEIARRTRLMLSAGQHGSLCMALGLGLPQIAFPQHLEHLFHARRAAALGTVQIIERGQHSAASIRQTILSAYADTDAPARAQTLSDELYPSLFGDIHTLVRQRLLPLLD